METVAEKVNSSALAELKSECGGIQTLLRNHSQIFEGLCVFVLIFLHFFVIWILSIMS